MLFHLLFIVYMESVVRKVCVNEEVEVTLVYADDLAKLLRTVKEPMTD